MKKLSMAAMLAAALLGVGAQAQDQTRDQIRDQTQDQTRELLRDQNIYGYQLMTPAEREQYRARMRAAQTNEERERIRAENHERMEARAREKGVNLPDVPPPEELKDEAQLRAITAHNPHDAGAQRLLGFLAGPAIALARVLSLSESGRAGHGGKEFDSAESRTLILAFLDKHLKR